ncbi:hypothetical protein A6R68_01149 [Neotoma lepida]|uniref:Uncharacterized protein n=1 Tax=Neotoma lepida TaxID=56216 RepID=A0A1A6GY89_NEOLE|nr:hypothetical protein A6R68_01149 [Neotoma lepida]
MTRFKSPKAQSINYSFEDETLLLQLPYWLLLVKKCQRSPDLQKTRLLLLGGHTLEVTYRSDQLLTEGNGQFPFGDALHEIRQKVAQTGTELRLRPLTDHSQHLHLQQAEEVQHRRAAHDQLQAVVNVVQDGYVLPVQ